VAPCPTCEDWQEVGRTKIGGALTSTYNFLGIEYCVVTSYYTVEEENLGECYSNRFVCDSDSVTFFNNGGCCHYTDPEDISHSDYCGGDNC